MNKRAFTIRARAVCLTLLLAVPAWPATPTISPELPDPGRVSMTREQQEKLGLQAMGEVYKQMPVLPDSSPVTQYIQQLGRKLVTVVPPEHSWPYQFHVIQQKDINAFALPGGPIFINIGTITAADNEAELAGVMAHEMSHVYMQHSAKQMPKQEWAGIVSALGGLLGGSAVGNLARMGIQLGAGSLLMKYSRGDEAQADAVGAIIMYKAGYNPRAMAEFFQKLEQQYGNGGPQFLSDHPNPGNRVEAVDKEIANWRPKSYLGTSDAFVRAKAEAARVKAYSAQQIADGAKTGAWAQENQQGGSIPASVPVSGNAGGGAAGATLSNVSLRQVMPSDNFKQLRTSSFSIAYPENWQTGSDQSGVTIAPAAGVAQGAISYGVVIGTANPNANNLDDATQDLIESLQQTNRGLRQSGSPQSIQVNGLQGRSVNLTSTSPVEQNGRAQLERDWLVTVARPSGGLLYLVFIAPENDFSQLRPTYEKILNSLQLR